MRQEGAVKTLKIITVLVCMLTAVVLTGCCCCRPPAAAMKPVRAARK